MTDDNSGTVELSRRKVLGGMATIGVAGAGAGAGTWAFFSDEETSEGNTVQAGTLGLGDPEDVVISTPNADFAPGDTTSGSITLSEDGNISGGAMDIDTSVTDGNFAGVLNVTQLDYGGTDVTPDSVTTLADLAGTTLEVDAPGSESDFDITLEFDEQAGNEHQGVSTDITFTFTLYQDASQQDSSDGS